MAENDNGAERTQDPTPRKLEQAREQGQVAFSVETNTAVLLLVGFSLLALMVPWLWEVSSFVLRWSLGEGLRLELTDANSLRTIWITHVPFLVWLTPMVITIALVALGISIAQVGWQPTLQPLQPKWSKINPISGMGRLFGIKGIARFLINLVKLIAITVIAWFAVDHHMGETMIMPSDLGTRTADEGWALWRIAMILAAALAIIGIADLIYQRWQHHKDLMMTVQEVKEEMKNSEGDPHVKGKIRQLQRQMAQKRMMQEVPKADVVITNPTHVAVALKYQSGTMAAPIVVAKGYDEVAQRIKAIAADHGVPMVENIPLARALAKEVELGRSIPGSWYQAVAEVLAAVYKLKKSKPD